MSYQFHLNRSINIKNAKILGKKTKLREEIDTLASSSTAAPDHYSCVKSLKESIFLPSV